MKVCNAYVNHKAKKIIKRLKIVSLIAKIDVNCYSLPTIYKIWISTSSRFYRVNYPPRSTSLKILVLNIGPGNQNPCGV